MNKNFSSTFTSSSNDPVRRGRRNFWQWLVEPVATITEVGERRQASLVSGILLVIPLAMSFGVFVNTVILHELTTAAILAGSVTVLGVAYILSRTRHYRLSVPLLLAVTSLYSILSVSIGNNYTSEGLLTILIFNILAIILSSTLASFRTTVFLVVANFLIILLLPIFIPEILYKNLIIPLIFNGVVSALILFLTLHRNQVEKDRLSEMDRINTTLQSTNTTLSALSSDLNARTSDLNLAAEVGRSISQVRELDAMLKDASELIRKQFGLYYVQVYLTNPSQTNLILQSGTGTVGVELVGRGHSLPLNTASINGRAAIEKHSVVISNTTESATFKPNPLLPNTRSEMAVPLMIGDRVVGVLDMQSEYSGSLNEETLPAFEALAGQLAIAIQNAISLAEAQQARAEVESQAQRLTRANWADYLDAIHKPEETGFVFEQNKIVPLAEESQIKENALTAPIAVSGETIGKLVVEMEGQSPIARTDELITTVARQVAQQIESLRLLDSAERYRAEAEEASRRITREGWKDYMDVNADQGSSYIYDLKEVRPHNHNIDQQIEDSDFSLPLKVRDETVGKLSVMGLKSDDKESLDLANAVAERLGTHIENLRQQDQTQSALAQSEKLFQASSQLTQAADMQELVKVAAEVMNIPVVNRAILDLFNYNSAGDLESMDVAATWWSGTGHEPTPLGTHYSIEALRVMSLFISPTPVFFNDAFSDERFDQSALQVAKSLSLRSGAVLPLHSRTRQIGVLFMEAEEPHTFTREEVRLFEALAPQITTVLENRRQFERAQKQAERESTLNVISQKIQGATTVEAVLQIAARELGHALGAPRTIAQLSIKDKK